MDNIFARLAGARYKRETTAADSSSSTATATDYTARIVNPTGRKSLLVPAWYRGVSLIMQTMGQMEVQYQRLNKEGGNFTADMYGPSRALNYLLQVRPNPMMTGSQLLEQIEFRKIYYGNAYVYIERNSVGDVAALWLCNSGQYIIGSDSYQLTYQKFGNLYQIFAPASDVLHFKNVFLDDNMLEGLPTVRFAMTALSIAATSDKQTLKDMAVGGKHKILVQEKPPESGTFGLLKGQANPDEMRKITTQLGEDFMSSDAVFLNNIADAKIISQTAAELRTLENRGFEVAELSRLLGIPTIMMMVDSGNNYKTPEAATQEFLLRTIQPRIREMEDEFNSKLLGVEDFGRRRIHICELALRRLDPAQQANLDKIHLETGAMSVNEIRRQYDRPTVEGGDDFYISTNLAMLGSDKLKSSGGAGMPVAPADNQPVEDDE